MVHFHQVLERIMFETFRDLQFEKAEEGKKRKRPIVTGSRENYCDTPSFAQKTTREELEELVKNLRRAGSASLFCEALESNEFMPCNDFETSLTKAMELKDHNLENDAKAMKITFIKELYELVPKYSCDVNLNKDLCAVIVAKVGVSVDESTRICYNTFAQSNDPGWYLERSKRLLRLTLGR